MVEVGEGEIKRSQRGKDSSASPSSGEKTFMLAALSPADWVLCLLVMEIQGGFFCAYL